jgi:hypothetical protein
MQTSGASRCEIAKPRLPLLPTPGIVGILSANPDVYKVRSSDQGRGRAP